MLWEGDARGVFGLDAAFVVDCKIYSFSGQGFSDKLHNLEILDNVVCDDTDTLGIHVLEIHASFLSGPWTETNG